MQRRKVAIKVLKPELVSGLGAERLLREIGIVAQLNHPHIRSRIDSGEADGLPHYVMPHAEGETLAQRLERARQLPLDEALAKSIAAALEFAHRRGIVHRDIKPENVLMHERTPMIADFGIAFAVCEAGGDRLPLAEALVAQGLIAMHCDWDLARSRLALERAVALNPNHAAGHQFLAWTQFSAGDCAGAVSTQKRALELDPLNVPLVAESGWPYSYAGLHGIARERYQRAVERWS